MRQSVGLYQRGFSVLELILTVTLLLGVAAVCVPGPAPELQSDEDRMATEACRSIARGLEDYQSDTGFLPEGRSGKKTFAWLRGPGPEPQFNDHPGGIASDLSWFLLKNKMGGGEKWGGPYVENLDADPWGHSYIVLFREEEKDNNESEVSLTRWVLSAGADGILQTTVYDSILSGDDRGVELN